MINVGAGMLDQEDGRSRAEGWCSWSDKVMFGELGTDRAGVVALEAGVKTTTSKASSGA